MTYEQLLDECKKLSPNTKAKFVLSLCDGKFTLDKFKQLIINTGLKWDNSNNEYREMGSTDFIEADDELDL